MNEYLPWILALAAMVISILTNRFLLQYLRRRNVLDIPNERSSHKIPTPRGGGIGVMAGIMLAGGAYCFITQDYNLLLILALSLVIGIVGWVDDVRKGLSSGLRFFIQLCCAAVLIYRFGPIQVLPLPEPANVDLWYFSYIITVMWLVGITNIFNFLDGIDGYAGTQGVVAGLGLFLMSMPLYFPNFGPYLNPHVSIGLIIAAACIGFLFFNWHPAKIFMGDVGSSFLGYLFAALPFYTWPGSTSWMQEQAEYVGEPRQEAFFLMAILLWFFLLDGTFTMLRRLLKGEKIWEAHRSHLYQRLVISGLSHSQVVLFVVALQIVLLACYYEFGRSWETLIAGFVLFLVMLGFTTWREKQVKAA